MRTKITFYGEKVEITTIEKETAKVRVHFAKQRDGIYRARRADSYRRSRKMLVRRVLSAIAEYGAPIFVTLTVEGQATNVHELSVSFSHFQRRLRAAYPLCQCISVPELSPTGRFHFHCLLFNVPLSVADKRAGRTVLSYGTERTDRKIAQCWSRGWVDTLQTDGNPRLGYYLTKYLGKAFGATLLLPMRLIRVTDGFPREIEVTDEYLVDKILKSYIMKMPDFEWEGYNSFLGRITKTYYTK